MRFDNTCTVSGKRNIPRVIPRLYGRVYKTLTLKDSFISESCIEIKIELNFYFHTFLWCLKRF